MSASADGAMANAAATVAAVKPWAIRATAAGFRGFRLITSEELFTTPEALRITELDDRCSSMGGKPWKTSISSSGIPNEVDMSFRRSSVVLVASFRTCFTTLPSNVSFRNMRAKSEGE